MTSAIQRSPEIYQMICRHHLDQNPQMIWEWNSLFEDEKVHISNVAASVMMTRDEFLRGGSFAQAVVNNDLHGAISRADSVIRKSIHFMVWVKENLYLDNSPLFEKLRNAEEIK